jgi:outer membrane protein assembly factor BamB
MFMHDLKHTGTPDNFVPTSNNTLWTYKLERGEIANQVASSAAVVNGIVYTASENGYVYAFDAYTGVCYWKYSLPCMGTLSSPSVVDGVVYIGSDYGLFALNAYTGEKIWQTANEVLIMSTPAVSGGYVFTGSFVSQGTEQHAAYAFRASDGQLVWKFTTSDYVDSSPAVVGSTVYINCDDGNLYALNAVNGALIWKFNTSSGYPYCQNSGSPAVVNGVVYTVDFQGNVFALNAADGQKIWNHSTERLGDGFTSPVVYNGIVYIATQNALYALNSATGVEIWQCAISSFSFPSIVNGFIYLTSSDGKIWAIDTSTGIKTAYYSLDSGVRVQAAIARGVIYVGTVQGKFYAIGTPDLITPQPTPNPHLQIIHNLPQLQRQQLTPQPSNKDTHKQPDASA